MAPPILTAERVGEIRVVEDIEEFRAELHVYAFTEAENLHRGEVHISEAEIAEGVAAHGTERTRCGRSHYGLPLCVAPPTCELVGGRLATRRGNARRRSRRCAGRNSDHVSASVGNKIRIGNPRDPGGPGGLEVRGTPGEIPAIYCFGGVAEIGSRVDDAPGLRAEQAHDGIELPSFQQLPVTLDPR